MKCFFLKKKSDYSQETIHFLLKLNVGKISNGVIRLLMKKDIFTPKYLRALEKSGIKLFYLSIFDNSFLQTHRETYNRTVLANHLYSKRKIHKTTVEEVLTASQISNGNKGIKFLAYVDEPVLHEALASPKCSYGMSVKFNRFIARRRRYDLLSFRLACTKYNKLGKLSPVQTRHVAGFLCDEPAKILNLFNPDYFNQEQANLDSDALEQEAPAPAISATP